MALIGSNIFIGNNDEQMFIGTDRYDRTTEPTFVGIITASDGASGDEFGSSVAVGSGKIVVGAPNNDVGINTNQGSAYIFDLNGNQLGILTASDGASGDKFGWSVAVGSGRIVVGAPNNNIGSNVDQGSAYIFDLDGNEVGIITASDGTNSDSFGDSVAIGFGRIVVGAINAGDNGGTTGGGQVYIYDLEGNEVGIITASNPVPTFGVNSFGNSVAVGSGRIVVGDPVDGEVSFLAGKSYVYDLDGNEVGIITAYDGGTTTRAFGSVVVVEDGKIIISAPNKDVNGINDMGGIYIYDTPKSYHILDTLDR